jgi:hypothetical protein
MLAVNTGDNSVFSFSESTGGSVNSHSSTWYLCWCSISPWVCSEDYRDLEAARMLFDSALSENGEAEPGRL